MKTDKDEGQVNAEYQLALLKMKLDMWVKKLERELSNQAIT